MIRGTQRRFPPKCIEHTFSPMQSTFKSLELHSTRRYKSCTCSVVLGQLESFRNYLGPQYYFSENFRCNFRFYESENFSDSSLHRIFESENFRFSFSTKNRLTWGLKMRKTKLQKIVGNLLDKLQKLYMNGMAIQKFLAFLK